MAGYMYLGSQRVCPVIVSGGGSGINAGYTVDKYGKLFIQRTGDAVFSGFTDIGDYIFMRLFAESYITSVDLSNLKRLTGQGACYAMFEYCTLLISVDLSNLETISSISSCFQMFHGCPSLISIDLSNLTTINGIKPCGQMFRDCTSLKSLSFQSLKTILDTNAFIDMLDGCSGVTMHFPSNMESTIAGLSGYPNFGGTNTTLLFDLPPTA